ncbi:histidine phosphatase family protein [Gordonia sp. zg691]|uniref:Histidine phosphatase family protein n=1 Tax=Gordonia jinghuaiqii TaxID=2758710 RepID=A0A7D7RP10_9ACTN|nr:histidine phosphatase family protein [Gordonia jinghuaiqii]MBD0861089.1 histidine phosphatase family protein [Gordonia jinghuaiqii]MCR5979751.1 histidine phosphatase family protein [Gordonia jinghuaiqii]QMT00853.1 histidine phosphatase family protein [Gordonia jinghuaiqii]
MSDIRTLILLRHGKSGYPPATPDHERPLAERGRRQAALAGRWMADEGLVVDAVLCSTSTRTRQTLAQTGIDAPVTFVDDLYGGTPEDILESIRIHAPAHARTLLVVGHEPGMPATALTLDPDAYIERFPTSAYAVVEVSHPWDRLGLAPDAQARLVGVRIPREE